MEAIKLTLPPTRGVLPFLFVFFLFTALDAVALGLGCNVLFLFIVPVTAVMVAAGVYGGYRINAFHPLLNRRYGSWLAGTLWTPDKPLPNGPVTLLPSDLLVVAILGCLAHVGLLIRLPLGSTGSIAVETLFVGPFTVFIGVYLAGSSLALVQGRQWWTAVAFLFAVPAGVLPGASLSLWPLLLFVVYVVAHIEHRRFLSRFPWNTDFWAFDTADRFRRLAFSAGVYGWPFHDLSWRWRFEPITLRAAIVLSLLFTWWWRASGLVLHFPYGPDDLVVLTGFLAAGRLALYVYRRMPPVSLLGRVRTLRLIIPKYDKVLIGSACAVAAAYAFPALLTTAGTTAGIEVAPVLAADLGLVLVCLILLRCSPSFRDWHLTGGHRMTRGLAFHEKQIAFETAP